MKNIFTRSAVPAVNCGAAYKLLSKISAFVLLVLLLMPVLSWAQPIFEENFNYTTGTAITANGWTAHSAGGTNPILVTNPGSISYPGYLSSGIGGDVTMTTSGEDDNKTFTPQTSGTIYASFLVNVTSANTAGDYFFHLGADVISTNFRGRVFVKRDASNNVYFGIAQSATPVNYTTTTYALNTTYLIVLKFDIVSGAGNDVSSIYVNPPLNSPIPVTGWIANTDAAGTDLANVGSVALRQGSASNAAGLKVDGIRISTVWEDIVGTGAANPTLTVNPTSLSGFNYYVGTGPSTSQSYALSGSYLTGYPGDIVVTAPAHYEISTDNSTFTSTINVPFASETLSATTIYTRLIAGLSAGNYNAETISHAGGGATTTYVTCNGYVIGPVQTYTWTGATSNDYQVSSNWSPARTSPAINDVLQFNNGGTYTITNVAPQTVGKFLVSAGTKITLQAATPGSIVIAGDTGDDLTVAGAGSELNISGTNALTISLSAGANGVIGGNMTFSTAGHKLLGADASSVIFQSGTVFTTGTGFGGNAFGTTSLNSVVFQSGSTYVHATGSNPFGASSPNSVVTFQAGSLYKIVGNPTPSFSGRVFANLEIDSPTFTISATGGSTISMDNLTVTNGTFNFNMTGTPGHSIKGNISVATGATLNFAPASAGTVNLNGTAAQGISGSGTINSSGAFSTIAINNAAGVTLNNSATFYNITVTSGIFKVASGGSLITNGTVTGNVAMDRYIGGWTDNAHGWHLISSPVANQGVAPAFTDGTPANYDFYKWDEVTNLWLNQKDGANGITSFTPGVGYLVAYASGSTKQFSGALNTTDVTVNNLTISGGANYSWNLIGNPFSCALLWSDGAVWEVPATIASTAKVWNEPTAAYVDIPSGGYIPALNGAMIQVLSGSPTSITLPTAARVHNTSNWYKSQQMGINLVAYDRTNSTSQQCIIRINNKATEGYDASYDSRFLAGYAPQFYSVCGTDYLSTNTLPDVNGNRVIQMGFVKNAASEFSIGLETENMIPGLSVYLTDKLTGAVTELKEGQEYTFTSSDGDDANRFLLHFSALGIDDPAAVSLYNIYASSGNIFISSQEQANADIIVSNLLGQVLLTGRTQGIGQTVISAGALQSGIYLVTVKSGRQVTTSKVMISK